MSKQLLKDTLGWGFILWLIGYALGMMLFAVVPLNLDRLGDYAGRYGHYFMGVVYKDQS